MSPEYKDSAGLEVVPGDGLVVADHHAGAGLEPMWVSNDFNKTLRMNLYSRTQIAPSKKPLLIGSRVRMSCVVEGEHACAYWEP